MDEYFSFTHDHLLDRRQVAEHLGHTLDNDGLDGIVRGHDTPGIGAQVASLAESDAAAEPDRLVLPDPRPASRGVNHGPAHCDHHQGGDATPIHVGIDSAADPARQHALTLHRGTSPLGRPPDPRRPTVPVGVHSPFHG